MTTNQEQSKQPKIKKQPNPTQTNQPTKKTNQNLWGYEFAV